MFERDGLNAVWIDWQRVMEAVSRATDFGLVRGSGGGCREVGPTGSDPRTRTPAIRSEHPIGSAEAHRVHTASPGVHTAGTPRTAGPDGSFHGPFGDGASPASTAGDAAGCSLSRRNLVPGRDAEAIPSADRWADGLSRQVGLGTACPSEVDPLSSKETEDKERVSP